ncbi:MAG: NPCBM/NEW2 domain-containing protein [Phycisphaerales bacterium]|nr:NPCBM/NEW2 domain-containing protein [Phycisphaerales bacterium]
MNQAATTAQRAVQNPEGSPISAQAITSRLASALVFSFASAAPACLALGSAVPQTPPPGAEVTVRTVDEDALFGRLIGLDPTAGLLLRVNAQEQRTIRLPDLVRIIFTEATGEPPQACWRVRLHNGDILDGWPTEGVEDVLSLQNRELGLARIPIEMIAGLELAPARTAAWTRRVVDLMTPATSEDRVLLTNGDALPGFISSIDSDAFTLDAPSGVTRIPRDVVVAVRFADAPDARTVPPCFRVDLLEGGRVTLESVTWQDNVIRGLAVFGEEVRAGADHIRAMHWVGGRWSWLSDVEPVSVTETPMLSLDWPHRRNRSVRGGPLVVHERVYEHGIGVHSRSVLAYDLAGEFSEFVTSFGLDDDSGPAGDVSIRILVDDKVRFEQQHVRRGRLFGPIRIDLIGQRPASSKPGDAEDRPGRPAARSTDSANPDAPAAKRLHLIVDFGDNGDIEDRFDWIEPALIRR